MKPIVKEKSDFEYSDCFRLLSILLSKFLVVNVEKLAMEIFHISVKQILGISGLSRIGSKEKT